MQRESWREKEAFQNKEALEEVVDRLEFLEREKKKRDSLPRVFDFAKVPYIQSRSGFIRKILNHPHWKFSERNGPIYTMSVMEQVREPGAHGGKHRHFGEALFYILEGKGWEVHDDKRYDWEEGDIMAVPSHTVHQHFGSPYGRTRMLAVIPTVNEFMGLGKREQIEIEPQLYEIPEKAKAMLGFDARYASMIEERLSIRGGNIGEVKTTYDRYLKLLAEENEWKGKVPHVLKAKDLPWEITRQGKIKFLIHQGLPSNLIGLHTFEAFKQEIPTGGRSGKHRHVGEEIHIILDGKGYDIQDDYRYEWHKDCLVCIPSHTTHQHFNSDSQRPARFLSIQTKFHILMGHGGIEHFEDAYP